MVMPTGLTEKTSWRKIELRKNLPVVLKLEGGLGNQLFQFAAGFYLAAKLSKNLELDQFAIPLTTVHGETKNGFESFQLPLLPSPNKIKFLKTIPSKFMVKIATQNELVKKILIKSRMYSSNRHNLDLFLETNEEKATTDFFEISSPKKLHGNFQSWKIVENAAQLGFPRIFKLQDLPQWITELESKIDFKNSIVLHFRVGDDTRTNLNFKQPEIVYYLNALNILKSKMKVTSTYILSDDIQRVKNLFGDVLGTEMHYLEMPKLSSPAERLYVLSQFGGIACANSTFCGWAAWSISNSGGNVVVPVPYSDGPVLGSRDFPSNWIQLNKYSGEISA